MSKTIKIKNKSIFLKSFLQPISKISDSVVLEIEKDSLSCFTCTSDNSIIFYSKFPIETDFDDGFLNCSDIKKLIRALDTINSEDVSFELERNSLSYKDKSVRFKYHLLEDGIIKTPKLSLQKLNSTTFNTSFILSYESFKDLIRGSVFSSDSNKAYISIENDGVYVELTDKTMNNIDSITFKIADSYDGDIVKSMPFNFDIFRIMEIGSKEVVIKINNKLGLAMFEVSHNYNNIKYVMPSLIK